MSAPGPHHPDSPKTSAENDGTASSAGSNGRWAKLQALPAWMQAIAALLGVLLSALVVFGFLRDPREAPPATQPVSTYATADRRVTLDAVTAGPDSVSGQGTYHSLDSRREVVLFLGKRVAGAGQDWLPVKADLTADPEAVDAAQSGLWQAVTPGTTGSYSWAAVVVVDSLGASDVMADIRANGPDSEYVLASSEIKTTD